MTTTTPPGWYPEPGHTGNGPAMERWWDGTAWSEYTRTAPVPDPGQPVYPGYPSGDPYAQPGPASRKTGTVVIALVVALVLIGGVVAGVIALGKGSDKNNASNGNPPAAASPDPGQGANGGQAPVPTPSGPGRQNPGSGGGTTAVDGYDGISLPVLSGWTGSANQGGVGSNVVIGQYPCPGDATKSCVRGGAFAEPAAAEKITATSPQAAAKADIAPNAANSYSTDIYGATTSHQEVASQAVTVAGQQGYFVRWKISTKSGTDGYVESLVFPSPSNSGKLVLVRFGFDVGGNAPGLDVMDQITQGIKADSSGGTSGTGV